VPIGVFLILRRMSLVGDAMSHAVLPGAAIAFLMFGFSLTAMTIGGFLVGERCRRRHHVQRVLIGRDKNVLDDRKLGALVAAHGADHANHADTA
jgi:hypothetical protein